MQASIKNNVVFCKKCEAHNYKCIDYKTITKDGKTHTQVIARCNECGTEFYFFTKIGIENEIHYVFDEEAAEEVKENLEMNKGIRSCDRSDCTNNINGDCSKEQIKLCDLVCNDFKESEGEKVNE